MTRVFQSLFLMLASATRQELARQVKYLKAENEVLRSRLPKRVDLEPKERNRLVRLGRKLGSKVVSELVSIVSPPRRFFAGSAKPHEQQDRTRRLSFVGSLGGRGRQKGSDNSSSGKWPRRHHVRAPHSLKMASHARAR